MEPLVTEYFYKLFQCFKEEKSILISHNRLFSTVGIKNDNNENILGIKGIPDALLITYDKDSTNTPLRINLIEYECYGEGKYRTTQKFNYLNGTIIPQLIRFASTFSTVTDYKIREKTINEWIEKIISYIDNNEILMDKVDDWMKDMNPKIRAREINSTLKSELKKAFESNIKIILIIDELTIEQKETITNVINSFKLNNTNIKGRDNSIGFTFLVYSNVLINETINNKIFSVEPIYKYNAINTYLVRFENKIEKQKGQVFQVNSIGQNQIIDDIMACMSIFFMGVFTTDKDYLYNLIMDSHDKMYIKKSPKELVPYIFDKNKFEPISEEKMYISRHWK